MGNRPSGFASELQKSSFPYKCNPYIYILIMCKPAFAVEHVNVTPHISIPLTACVSVCVGMCVSHECEKLKKKQLAVISTVNDPEGLFASSRLAL